MFFLVPVKIESVLKDPIIISLQFIIFSLQIHCAENLLKPEQYKKWLSSKGSDERITCILELEKSSLISSIDIGNDGSAFVELFVSRSSSSKPDDWTVLLPATLLMTPSDSRSNTNRNQVKLLKSTDLNKTCLNEKWDRLKIVCEQKFNRLNPFGLCFIKLYSPSTLSDETNQSELLNKSSIMISKDDDEDETGKEQNKIGSFFAKKQAEKNLKISQPTPSDQIRALSNVADELLSKKPMNDNEIQTLLNKDVKVQKRFINS
jgi:DNA-repair protein XRCC1